MAAAAVDICNEALALVGASPIASLSDATTPARLLNSIYTPTRDELLICHPWKFATKRVPLAADPTAPIFDYSYRFALPADCLRVIGTDLGSTMRWTVENGYLLCDFSAVSIKYISKITTEATFTINFCEALAYKLASKIAFPLTQSAALVTSLGQTSLVYLKDAKSMNGQEGNGDRVHAEDWLDSRF